jgi:hypothetical protein
VVLQIPVHFRLRRPQRRERERSLSHRRLAVPLSVMELSLRLIRTLRESN